MQDVDEMKRQQWSRLTGSSNFRFSREVVFINTSWFFCFSNGKAQHRAGCSHGGFVGERGLPAYSFLPLFLGRRTAWMLGSTPPSAMVTPASSLDSSSSLRTASWMWRGTMRVFLLSRAALPDSSSTSAARYSRTAARYTGAPAPMRSAK